MLPQPAPEKRKTATGPRTQAGKAISSKNAIRHGLASGTLIMPGESQADFDALLQGLLEEWSPATQTERLHVENMARHQWLVERACRLQGELLAVSDVSALPPSFAVLLRYQTANERAFVRAQKTLEAMQDLRKQQFVSQNAEMPALPFFVPPPRDYAKDLEMLRQLREERAPKAARQGAS